MTTELPGEDETTTIDAMHAAWLSTETGKRMTTPAATTPGIVAFIEARCDDDDVVAFHMEDHRHEALTAMRRAILALHRVYVEGDPREAECHECSLLYPCQTVRLLAAIDADHPAYDASWKPVAG